MLLAKYNSDWFYTETWLGDRVQNLVILRAQYINTIVSLESISIEKCNWSSIQAATLCLWPGADA